MYTPLSASVFEMARVPEWPRPITVISIRIEKRLAVASKYARILALLRFGMRAKFMHSSYKLSLSLCAALAAEGSQDPCLQTWGQGGDHGVMRARSCPIQSV